MGVANGQWRKAWGEKRYVKYKRWGEIVLQKQGEPHERERDGFVKTHTRGRLAFRCCMESPREFARTRFCQRLKAKCMSSIELHEPTTDFLSFNYVYGLMCFLIINLLLFFIHVQIFLVTWKSIEPQKSTWLADWLLWLWMNMTRSSFVRIFVCLVFIGLDLLLFHCTWKYFLRLWFISSR